MMNVSMLLLTRPSMVMFLSLSLYLSHDPDMIHEHSPITNAFVSVPADMGQLNCAAFIAGILAGILDAAKFVRDTILHSVTCCSGT